IRAVAVRTDRVAVEVHAEVGSVVAAQTLVFTAESGTPGVAWTIGAPAPSDHWLFADGAVEAGASSWITLTNVGSDDTDVTVQAFLEARQVAAPLQLTLAPDDVQWVKLGGGAAREGNRLQISGGGRLGFSVRGGPGRASGA